MKQILILYFCYFESMSSCKRTSTRTQETVKVEATLSASVSLSLGTPTVQNSLLYTVHSTERARRQCGIGELNHGRVCLTRARQRSTGFRTVREVRAPPTEFGATNILNWFADGGACCASQHPMHIRAVCTN